jgi:hypothetical protein
MRIISEFIGYVDQRINTLNNRQKTYFRAMSSVDKMTLCIPTGAGKGYLMITHLIDRIVNSKEDLFLTLSHRLTLNTQHLNDIVDSLDPLLGRVGFIFIGSSRYNNSYDKINNTDNSHLTTDEIASKIKFNRFCLNNKISTQDLFTSTLDSQVLKDTIDRHRIAGRKIVIVSTYHSVNILGSSNVSIDVTYCDEAHTLATDYFSGDISFFSSFCKLNSKKTLFFTATPKDCDDNSVSNQSALMNNKHIYGERIGMSFKEAIDDGYVVQPIIHSAFLKDGYVDKEINMSSVSKFVMDTYDKHCEWVKEVSSQPDLINGKLLIKCESVKMMWKLASVLIDANPDITICCGASNTEYNPENIPIGLTHRINGEYIRKRENYLERLQSFESDEKAIVLHFDTLSEGINVASFTGVMFLTDNLPSKSKLLQNTGRSTRLHPWDREQLRLGNIKVHEYGTWVKPHCAIIIPYWNNNGGIVNQTIAETIVSLREDYGFKSSSDYGLGNDLGKGSNAAAKEQLNVTKFYKEGSLDLTSHTIEQMVEDLYIDLKKVIQSEKLDKMSNNEWFLHNFNQ